MKGIERQTQNRRIVLRKPDKTVNLNCPLETCSIQSYGVNVFVFVLVASHVEALVVQREK